MARSRSTAASAIQQTELRPGDEGFEGFHRQLPENCVEYMLFLIERPEQKDARKTRSGLEAVRKEAVRLSSELTRDYIWQREAFFLELKNEQGLFFLHGTTDYGDCVEDEWLIVYILRELSKTFSSLWARASDGDGEFLLVEAASVLPKWLNPEIDGNRVWIHGGKLNIIPIGDAARSGSRSLRLAEAVGTLESDPESLIHSPLIEAEAFYRLEKYPGQIADSLHYARVTVPRRLAYIIHGCPAAIAPATEAFYLRHPSAMKPLMSGSADLIFPPSDLVTVSVRFTRVLFAQLKSQRFETPPAWASLMQAAEEEASEGSEEARGRLSRLEMGMKVASGFEMLAKDAHGSDSRIVREVALVIEDLDEDGDSVLPSDADISAWKDAGRDDDDSWLDINYEDFERELDGKRGAVPESRTAGADFGDASAQADLRKMVSRFEAFLNDERAGLEGAGLDEMDEDDGEDGEDDSSEDGSEGEDREVGFDEVQFASMMRQMMGLPSEEERPEEGKGAATSKGSPETGSGLGDEDREIEQLMVQMESELNQHGALDLDPRPRKPSALKGRATGSQQGEGPNFEEGEEEGVDLDYHLAKNLLESFKSQAGMAGPAGNILSMMGMRLPRDEEDEDDSPKGA